MRPIVLGTISLDQVAGGLEKNFVLLANHLVKNGYDVNLITFDLPDAVSFYQLDPKIRWYKVARTRPHGPIGFFDRINLILRIREVLRNLGKPDLICFHHGVLPRFYLASFGLGLRIICSERNSLTLYNHIRQAKWTLGFLMLAVTKKITVQFPEYVFEYPMWLRNRIAVIPNPVYPVDSRAFPELPSKTGRFTVLTIGRLCTQKNQKTLIEAFAEVADKHPTWDLRIVGDGDAYEDLAEVIANKQMLGRIYLEGKQSNVSAWLSDAHVFCLPSTWEGFPNALAEAMAHGLPCLGFLECAGVRDLIYHGETGILVQNGKLRDGLDTLMSSGSKRAEMGLAAINAISKYRPRDTFVKWDMLLERLASST